MEISKYLNQLTSRSKIAEIGCGLGGILRHVNFNYKVGYDIDRKALKAASFLSRIYGKNIHFKYFNFPIDSLKDDFDVIIMVNWIHNIPPPILLEYINQYFNQYLKEEGMLIIDTVYGDNYKYHHSIDTLVEGLNCLIEKIYTDPRVGREVFSIIKK
jgi:SAM-dependent methyltransferase